MERLGQTFRSFTVKYDAKVNALVTEVAVGVAFDPKTEHPPSLINYKAIWDTGATNSVITSKVVTECGLKPVSRVIVHTAGGDAECLVYFVWIRLPNQAGFPQVRVTEATIADGIDMLIGMDLISGGDFAVTTSDGKTTLTYCHPSCRRLDFVEEANAAKAQSAEPYPNAGRNAPCPCRSGKKYKNCCLRKARP